MGTSALMASLAKSSGSISLGSGSKPDQTVSPSILPKWREILHTELWNSKWKTRAAVMARSRCENCKRSGLKTGAACSVLHGQTSKLLVRTGTVRHGTSLLMRGVLWLAAAQLVGDDVVGKPWRSSYLGQMRWTGIIESTEQTRCASAIAGQRPPHTPKGYLSRRSKTKHGNNMSERYQTILLCLFFGNNFYLPICPSRHRNSAPPQENARQPHEHNG